MMLFQLYPMSKYKYYLNSSTSVKVEISGEMGLTDAILNFILVLFGSMLIGYLIGLLCAYVLSSKINYEDFKKKK